MSDAPVIGIELGREVCRVAVLWNGGQVMLLQDANFSTSTPSYIHVRKDGSRVIGAEAKEMAKVEPRRSIFGGAVLELLGRNFDEIGSIPEIENMLGGLKPVGVLGKPGIGVEELQVGGLLRPLFYPEQVVAMLITRMREIAEESLGGEVRVDPTVVVITVPTGASLKYRQGVREAGTIAGFSEVILLSRCNAGLVWHEFQQSAGGGGFPVSSNKVAVVVDFEFESEWSSYALSTVQVRDNVMEELRSGYEHDKAVVPRVSEVLSEHEGKGQDITTSLIVIGETGQDDHKRRCLNQTFGSRVSSCSELANPENHVVNGAAVYAALMMMTRNPNHHHSLTHHHHHQVPQLTPGAPWTVGVVDQTGAFTPIIPRHSPIGVEQRAQLRQTPVDSEGGLFLKVYEGDVGPLGYLGFVRIFGFEAGDDDDDEGMANVQLTFQISTNNGTSLEVSAVCGRTGAECEVHFGKDWFARGSIIQAH